MLLPMLTRRAAIIHCYRRGFASSSGATLAAIGKSALVTGGSVGIGAAIARRLADDGYSVFIADVYQKDGEALAKEIGGSFLQVDVSDSKQVEAAVSEVVAQHSGGRLDALVNNAGVVSPNLVPIGEIEEDEWKRILDVNLNGTFYGMKFGLAQMAKQPEGGNIVNMCSTAAFRGVVNLAPYVASKFAVRGLTKAAAVEYGFKNIRVNAIAPTGTETPMVMGFIENSPDPDLMMEAMTGFNAMPGFPQPSDVASAAAFLLSEDSRYITGHTLPVDAGALSRVANQREMFNVK
jgi:meso-butanediol dehydrogenase/(S,S)-butanediol dehydrogenase/diacetyl reductase